jgi:hypothetical protein
MSVEQAQHYVTSSTNLKRSIVSVSDWSSLRCASAPRRIQNVSVLGRAQKLEAGRNYWVRLPCSSGSLDMSTRKIQGFGALLKKVAPFTVRCLKNSSTFTSNDKASSVLRNARLCAERRRL